VTGVARGLQSHMERGGETSMNLRILIYLCIPLSCLGFLMASAAAQGIASAKGNALYLSCRPTSSSLAAPCDSVSGDGLCVRVDGASVPVGLWRYDSLSNAVLLQTTPESYARIEISYQYKRASCASELLVQGVASP